MSDTAPPGWYHAEGDPKGTVRYWDGTTWSEGPVAAAAPPPPDSAVADEAASPPLEEQAATASHPERERSEFPSPSANGWYRAFSTTGRVNRLTAFLLLMLPGPVLGTALFGLLFVVLSSSGETSEHQNEPAVPEAIAVVLVTAALAAMAAVTWLNAATAGKRLHDIGMSAWLVLLVFIPMGSLALAVLCFLVPGKPEPNNHGMPPPPGFRV
ncbi:MAG: DUF805 domain-containing protein [Thermoflexaceae bacterium]|nr:DUF805 domain-containing protein [Thermoflexaceae bacterium]